MAIELQTANAITDHTIELNENDNQPLVLVIEDHQDMRKYVGSCLQPEYQVVEAYNGIQGLEMIDQYDFDLVISDVMMPEMDGLEFCKRVKENVVTSHIPIILLTAKMYEENMMDGYLLGADDYITKPFNSELLKIRVKNLIASRKNGQTAFQSEFSLEPPEIKLPSADEKFLKELVDLMEANISEVAFNVEKMAHTMGISRTQFIRKVKKLTGDKPVDLLKNYRLKRAKQLLIQEQVSISEVAYMVGYDNPGSFSRAFRKKFEQSPSDYVKNQTV